MNSNAHASLLQGFQSLRFWRIGPFIHVFKGFHEHDKALDLTLTKMNPFEVLNFNTLTCHFFHWWKPCLNVIYTFCKTIFDLLQLCLNSRDKNLFDCSKANLFDGYHYVRANKKLTIILFTYISTIKNLLRKAKKTSFVHRTK